MDFSKFVSSLNGKAAYVYGLGKSGLASVDALISSGASVIAWDSKEGQKQKASDLGARLLDEENVDFNEVGALILSPGIPLTHPKPHAVVDKARGAGVEVIGDIEVLGRCLPASIKTIGITGTNGKSTTTALIGHILKECGVRAAVAGNIGTPALSLAVPPPMGRGLGGGGKLSGGGKIEHTNDSEHPHPNPPPEGEGTYPDVLVLEMSSYQIDLCPTFRPDIGILLNITADHLDRHGTLENYAAVKAKMIGPQTKGIISVDDDYCAEIHTQNKDNSPIKLTLKENIPFDMKGVDALAGAHNIQNALAAWYAVQELGLDEANILAAMRTFPGLAHRQQIVRKIGNVTFINDSKATNAEAAAKALGTYKNIYWIVGGQAKEGGLNGLEEFMSRVTKAYVIGEAGYDFSRWLSHQKVAYNMSGDIAHALAEAYNDSYNKSDSIILLSPACASWDQFKSFEHRGDVFIEMVKAIETYSIEDGVADVLGNLLGSILSN